MTETETKKIRVCFVCPKAYPLFNSDIQAVFGGAEVDLYLLATELAKDSLFDVKFIVGDYDQAEEETRENVRILKSLNFRQNSIIGAIKIWKAMKRADADWYMLETASPGVPLCRLFTWFFGRKLLYRTASEEECNRLYLKTKPILGRVFIRSIKKTERVIVQNQHDQELLKTHFNIDSWVIPNGHRIPDSIQFDKDSILWVGRSAAVKGPQRFIELACEMPNEKFVMICQRATDDMRYDALKKKAEEIKNLLFIERIGFHEIDNYFSRAKVLVNTSDSEGFPNTFIQACKVGTAILSYTINPDGFLDTHQCGTACHSDMPEMVSQLRRLLDDNRYLKLGRNGSKYVREKHDITQIVGQYKEIFKG